MARTALNLERYFCLDNERKVTIQGTKHRRSHQRSRRNTSIPPCISQGELATVTTTKKSNTSLFFVSVTVQCRLVGKVWFHTVIQGPRFFPTADSYTLAPQSPAPHPLHLSSNWEERETTLKIAQKTSRARPGRGKCHFFQNPLPLTAGEAGRYSLAMISEGRLLSVFWESSHGEIKVLCKF